jgi:hypothetical protein
MTNATCEQCLRTEGTRYEFRYGRMTSDQVLVGGVEEVVLCKQCLVRARLRRAGRVVLHEWFREPLAAVGYAAWAVALAVSAWQGEWAWFLVGVAAGLAVTAIVAGLIYAELRDEDFAQHLAVDLHQEKLRKEGWDSFWTEAEFALRAPH